MIRPREQFRLRLSSEPDPRYCARALCNVIRRRVATYTITIGRKSFRVCSDCARRWDGARGAVVRRITEVKSA